MPRLTWGSGLTLVVLLLVVAGLFFAPHDPLAQDFRQAAYEGPSGKHWLGVDASGRDFLSRLWVGAAHTVLMGMSSLLLALLIAGLLVATERSWRRLAGVILSVIGIWVAVPVVLLSLVLLVFLQPSAGTLVFAAALGLVPLTFRQLRVLWLEQAQATYVQASRVLGAQPWRLFAWTILPNLLPSVLALSRLVFALAVLELSGLAFLGLIGDPDFPELGALMRQNQPYLFRAPHLVVLPGLALTFLLLLNHLSRPARR